MKGGNRRNSTTPRPPAQGLSLVELMVALVLGAFLIAALIQFFMGNRMTYLANEGFARVQESGRFALEDFKREMRETGTHGFCAARINIRNHLNDCGGFTGQLFDTNRPLIGFEYDGSGPGDSLVLPDSPDPDSATTGEWSSSSAGQLPAALDGLVVPGSDVVIFRSLRVVPGLTAVGNTPANANAINLNAAHGLPDNAIVLVTNCASGADLFQNRTNANATAFSRGGGPSCGSSGPGNQNLGAWSTAYGPEMQAFQARVVAYYVGRNDETGEPGLFRLILSEGAPRTSEVIDGVENLQVLYGFSLPAESGGDGQSVNHWLTADQVPDWGLVIAARLAIVTRSPEIGDSDRDAQTFDLAGTIATSPTDGRIRNAFSTTVALRNRMLVY